MKIYINNEEHSFDAPLPITDALSSIGIKNLDGTAIAVNESVVPKSEWPEKLLKNEDKLLLIKATCGG